MPYRLNAPMKKQALHVLTSGYHAHPKRPVNAPMKKQALHVPCNHLDPRKIIQTDDGERICRCGVVLEEKIPESTVFAQQSRMSLYHKVEVGGSPEDMKVVNRNIHIYSPNSSEFSNICSKLFMSESIQSRAWHIYSALRSHTYFSRAKCAIFSVYVACREGGQPIDERQIQESVHSTLCVKKIPTILAVISELHNAARELGINSNNGHSDEYYLNLETSRNQSRFRDSHMYDLFKRTCVNYFASLSGNPQNRARRAVDMVLSEMGMMK